MGRSSTSFQPGRSGNPGGRPAGLAEVQQLARAETAANVQALVRIRDAVDSPPAAVIAAVTALLDRAWGRPSQAITGADGGALALTIEVVTGVARGDEPPAIEGHAEEVH